jgi:hypothetical protein
MRPSLGKQWRRLNDRFGEMWPSAVGRLETAPRPKRALGQCSTLLTVVDQNHERDQEGRRQLGLQRSQAGEGLQGGGLLRSLLQCDRADRVRTAQPQRIAAAARGAYFGRRLGGSVTRIVLPTFLGGNVLRALAPISRAAGLFYWSFATSFEVRPVP